jgi:hypothetical protein
MVRWVAERTVCGGDAMGIAHDDHFISREMLPIVKMDASVLATLKVLFEAGSGGFIIADDISPRFYLAGN